VREFESLYDLLHIAGYYRGLLYHRKVVRESTRRCSVLRREGRVVQTACRPGSRPFVPLWYRAPGRHAP
jgi:hypothetical protein